MARGTTLLHRRDIMPRDALTEVRVHTPALLTSGEPVAAYYLMQLVF